MDLAAIAFGTVGGLALFLYGLHTLSDGLKKVAGEKIKLTLEKITDNPLKGSLIGALTTATMQSSSLTMVTLIGLVNAGLLTLRQGIGVMLGSEIGTTLTAQLIAFKVGVYYLPLVAFGFFFSFLTKKRRYKSIGQAILGFGILFLGMNIMSSSVQPLQSELFLGGFLFSLGEVPVLGVLAGAILTGILQSSSALAGLVISMGMNDLVTLNAAIPILFGANIGTCITGLFASIGSSISSRRLALAQLMINIIGVSIFFPFLSDFAAFVGMTSSDLPRQIANAHSIFNVIVTALMLPLTPFLVTIVERLLPGEESRISRGTEFIDRRLLNTPSVALSQAEKEIVRMTKITYEMLDEATTAILSGSQKVIENILETESMVDELNETIDRFLDDIPSENLSEREVRRLAYLKHSITDIERVGDHANNLAELAERKLKEEVPFSIYATEELETMSEKAKLAYEKALTILGDGNKMLIQEVLALEDEIDALQRTFEANHVRRLENKICNPLLGIVFVDILRNLERIADHSTNIANATLLGF